MHWGLRLKQEREAQGLTGSQVGAYAGVTKGAVSQWENGGNIKPENLFAVADRMKIEPRWLATGKGPKAAVVEPEAEQELIRLFRSLSEQGRQYLLQDAKKYAGTLVAADPPLSKEQGQRAATPRAEKIQT